MNIRNIKNRGVIFTYENPSACNLNLYLIRGKKFNYLIDTGLGSFCAEPIKKYLKSDRKQLIVINTHHHFDHIWGNASFDSCIIISHKLCYEKIQAEWEDMLQNYGHRCYGKVKMKLPNLVFENELYFAEDKV